MMEESLNQHIIKPLNSACGRKLQAVCYHDIYPEHDLINNQHGTDIIALQLELSFEGGA